MKRANFISSVSANKKRKAGKPKQKNSTPTPASGESVYRIVKGSPVPTTNSKEKIREAVVAAIY
jgi:hypothetical protein